VQNGKKDRLDRIEALAAENTRGLADLRKLVEANTTDWRKAEASLAHTRELLNMAAAQTVENKRELAQFSKEFRVDLAKSRKEHDREMKQIRALFKDMIRRIAV